MYDAIISGAGPAGASCALILAKNGRNVLLLEKAPLPRYKACGGGLSQKALNLLKDNLNLQEVDSVIETKIYNVQFIYKFDNCVSVNFDYPVVSMCMRDKFDHLLVKKAAKNGATVKSGEKALEIETGYREIKVITNQSFYKGKYFIGADGAHSIAAKLFSNRKKNAIAVEAEISATAKTNFQKDKLELHYGIIPHGYGWIFPKKEVISLGIGSFLPSIKGLQKYYRSFKKGAGFENTKELILKAHPIPLPTERTLCNERVVLIGDAAGLADPLCGEGIYYALKSGLLAAEALMQDKTGLYAESVTKHFLPQLRQAEKLSRIIYGALPLINRLVNSDPQIARKLVNVVYGSENYSDLFSYLAGKYNIFKRA